MLKLKLNTVYFHDGKYTIYLDKETKFYFSNKRKAQDFLTQLSKRIDQSLLFITESTSQLTEFYNLYSLDDDDYKFQFEVKNCLEYLNNRIAWVTHRQGSDNRQAIVIQSINGCFRELTQAFSLIHDKAARRNDTLLKRRCELRIDIINMYSENYMHSDYREQAQMKAV
jgi:hypothetical protein